MATPKAILRLSPKAPQLEGMAPSYGRYWRDYAARWDRMVITKPAVIEKAARFALQTENRGQYEMIERKTGGVPWPLVAIIHRRESDADFATYLGNGETLKRTTRLVPKGRGPFSSWQEGALDALDVDGLASWQDWRLEKIIYACEITNGFGYRIASIDIPSPYLWSRTNQQVRGKFTNDGHFDARVMDTQPGCCAILARIVEIGELQNAPWMRRET